MYANRLIQTVFVACLAVASAPATAENTSPAVATGQRIIEKYGTILYRTRWKTRQVSVCWESLATSTAQQRNLVQKSVTDSWQDNSGIRFVWSVSRCVGNEPGIHIQVTNIRPRTERLGKLLDGRENGMKLNFDPSTYARVACAGRANECIKALAVHEFGHALGFTHEQNRPDAPAECRDEHKSGSVGDYLVTEYDPKSIMNYCEPLWTGTGALSKLDKDAVREIYP